MRHPWLTTCCCLLVVLALGPSAAPAQDDAAPAPAEQADGDQKPHASDAVQAAIDKINEQDNGVTINREGMYVDVKAKVCLRAGEFLEMFACTKDTREHESIVVLEAMPSTMHVGLLLLGLEPGKPLRYDVEADPPKLLPPIGPKVQVFVVREVAGQEREIPANRWVKDNKTGKMMQGNTWLFAGSAFAEYEGKELYHADVNGSAISLVNFGDDLLTLPNMMTQENDSHNKVWAPRTDAIPKVGTEVVLRLRAEKPEDEKEAEDGDEASEAAAENAEPDAAEAPAEGE